MKLFLSPHFDDETLFGAFTIIREKPITVAVVFDSFIQVARGHSGCTTDIRRRETWDAMRILQGPNPDVYALGFPDERPVDIGALANALREYGQPEVVYAPAVEEGGHIQHNIVGALAKEVFQSVVPYMTYTRNGKSTGRLVEYEPEWAALKVRALACYQSQISLADNVEHFLRSQHEYYAA